MARQRFQIVPGAIGGSAQITNLKALMAPRGTVKTKLLDRLSGSYTDVQRSMMCWTWFQLLDAGLFDKLDMICIKGRNAADSLINWKFGRGGATNNGAAWSQSLGFTTNGSSSWINLNFSPELFTIPDASIFAYVPDGVDLAADAMLMGRAVGGAGGQYVRLAPVSSVEGSASARINTSGSVIGPRPNPADHAGLWCANMYGGANQSLTQRNVTVATDTRTAATPLQSSLAIGTDNGSLWGAVSVGAFGYGGNLQSADRQALSDILDTHFRAI